MKLINELVDPYSRLELKLINGTLRTSAGDCYQIANDIPIFLKSDILTAHQQSELEASLPYINKVISLNQPEFCWGWCSTYLNNDNISKDDVVVCIGGSFTDDIPHIKSDYKFNIDHLAHRYVSYLPKMINSNIQHVACEAEQLPFKSNCIKCVYMRNSLDHVCNPLQVIKEVYRVLKNDALFISSTYHNSSIINEHESTSIDDEFVDKCIRPIFNIMHLSVNNKMINIIGTKKENHVLSFSDDDINTVTKILFHFHSALYYERTNNNALSQYHYSEVVKLRPILSTDVNRIQYSQEKLYV